MATRRTSLRIGAVALVVAVIAVVASSSAVASKSTVAKPTVTTKKLRGLGVVLVNSRGRTLYMFVPDKQKRVTCKGSW